MKALGFGGMLLLCGALAACSSESTGGTGTGGSGAGGDDTGAGGGDGGATAGPAQGTGTNTGSTGQGPGPSTGVTTASGTNDCPADVFQDAALNTCGQENCCPEMTACAGDLTTCFNAEGQLDTSLPGGEAIANCLTESGCIDAPAGICGTPLTFDEGGPQDVCLGNNCCDPFVACAGADGGNSDACNDCLAAGGGELCDAFLACADENCTGDVCGTGLTFDLNGPVDTCIADSCCESFTACTGADGANAEACNACLEANGGALCDSFIACVTDAGCFE